MKYPHSVLGGTFDHLHLGHKDLLNETFNHSEEVTIGLTTEKLYKQKFLAHLIDPYQVRELELKDYLKQKNYLSRAKIIELNDIYGPTLDANNFQAIFVTERTQPNADIVNKERQSRGLTPLETNIVPLRKDESGEVITSERIRLGEIDREGKVYMHIFKNKTQLTLPQNLREELRHPIGEAITDVQNIKKTLTRESLLISVGDIVSKSLKDIDVTPDIEIIDFKTRRSLIDKKSLNNYKGKKHHNPPATIHKEAVEAFKSTIDSIIATPQKHTIVIDGEEDLLTLPAILLAPLKSTICYGQFDLNAVIRVEVSEEKKKFILDLLRKFD